MNDSVVAPLLARLGGPRQAGIILVGVVVTALVFGVSRWATRPTMVPLFADLPVGQVKGMTDRLTEATIPFQLDATGTTILVASGDVARARVELAAGETPDAGRPGLELFDKPSWGLTDFTQKVNLRRALEGELERTIGKMQDVEAVQVHLALEEATMFRAEERPSKASVTLRMAGGRQPSPETVRGIASLVAGSVGGLRPEHVTLVDSRGQALMTGDDGSLGGLTNRQLSVQREVEGYLEAKADRLLSSLVGAGNARIQVAAVVNFNKIERTTQSVDPERQVTASEQRAEVTPSTPQQGAGYATSSTAYENSRSVENFSGAIGNVTRLTVAVLVADRVTYPAPAPDTVPADSARAAAPPAPVVIARTPEELARIETLVRSALGVDSARGDVVSVVSAPFDLPAPPMVRDTVPAPPRDLVGRLLENPKPVVAVVALLVLLVLGLVVTRMLRSAPLRPRVSAPAAALALPGGSAELRLPDPAMAVEAALPVPEPVPQLAAGPDDGSAMLPVPAVAPAPPPRPALPPPPQIASTPERDQALSLIESRPDAAVRVIRNWLHN
jgi:flagellar M-ring protein FliF